MNLQVILSEDVPNLGRTGDVVRVRPGFARNYLLPRKLAVEANPKSLRAFEHNKRIAIGKREVQKTEATGLKQKLEALTIIIGAPAMVIENILDYQDALLNLGLQSAG